MKVAVAQITSTNQPDENLKYVLDLMEQSVGQDILFLPEVTNCISSDWVHLNNVLCLYEGNFFIKKTPGAKVCTPDVFLIQWTR